MNREEAKEFLPIIKAFAEGKTIQSKQINASDKEWRDIEECNFLREHSYRIKPEPKYRPFQCVEECWNEMLKHQPFGWLKTSWYNCNHDRYEQINDVLQCRIRFNANEYTYKEAFQKVTFADGTPFGVKEEQP